MTRGIFFSAIPRIKASKFSVICRGQLVSLIGTWIERAALARLPADQFAALLGIFVLRTSSDGLLSSVADMS